MGVFKKTCTLNTKVMLEILHYIQETQVTGFHTHKNAYKLNKDLAYKLHYRIHAGKCLVCRHCTHTCIGDMFPERESSLDKKFFR